MSGSLFLFAIAIVAATWYLIYIINSYDLNEGLILPIAGTGVVLALVVLFLSFNFMNVAHLSAWFKYDHVIALEYKIGTSPLRPIEPNKVIYQKDFVDANVTTVVMAWNDKKMKYDDIVNAD